MALDFQCFFEAFSGDLLAQPGDGAPAWGDILPLCLISLLISLFYLGSPPFRPLESEVFQLTEWGIRLWFSLMEEIHKIGVWAVIEGKLTWSIQEYALYYLMLLSIGFGIFFWRPLKSFFSNKARFSQHVNLKVRR